MFNHKKKNIYKNSPTDWKDLQIKVAEILSCIGYECEIEKNIQTIREVINVDVFAIHIKDTPQSSIICECKYWSNAIPKTVIHSFRTTVSDFGANYGIIISKRGFQSGSYKAIKNTNILLLNWQEFQDYFKVKWIINKTLETSIETKSLYNYISVGFPLFFKEEYNSLNMEERRLFDSLYIEYFDFAFNGSNLDYKNIETQKFDITFFEMFLNEIEKKYSINFDSYYEYFEYIKNKCKEGTEKFDKLFKKKLRMR